MGQVKGVPDGYTTVTPFLNIKGAANAIELYKKAFGAEELFRFLGPSGQIMQCEIKIGNSIVRLAESVTDAPTASGLQLYVENADVWWSRAVAAGLEVVMPIQDMFWGDRWGLLKDTYGNRWAIQQRIEDLSNEEVQRRGSEAMKNRQYPGK